MSVAHETRMTKINNTDYVNNDMTPNIDVCRHVSNKIMEIQTGKFGNGKIIK